MAVAPFMLSSLNFLFFLALLVFYIRQAFIEKNFIISVKSEDLNSNMKVTVSTKVPVRNLLSKI